MTGAITSGPHLLVVGDVMLDRYWFGDVHRISPEAPVPIVRITQREDRAGGAANVARNARALGAAVTLLAVTGDDPEASCLRKLLATDGIHTEFIRSSAAPTTVKLRVLGGHQQLLRIDFESKPQLQQTDLQVAAFDTLMHSCDALILSDYGKGGLVQVQEMVRRATESRKPVFIDPKGRDFGKYAGATVLTPNKAELAAVVGEWHDEADLRHRAEQLRRALRLHYLLVTRSEEGMTLFGDGEVVHEPARAQEVFDVSGAGDTVLATLACGIASGLDWRTAMKRANTAAGIVVGRIGTAVVTSEELESEGRT